MIAGVPKPRGSPFPKEIRMATTESPDHDQRLKVLLKEFFEQFLRCFFPAWPTASISRS
jgi:hypothetical protein